MTRGPLSLFYTFCLFNHFLRHLQSSVTSPFLFNWHYTSHCSRVLNSPFLLSPDQSTSSRKGTGVIQLLYSSYLLHNIVTFFRSHKYIKLVTLPNFSSKKYFRYTKVNPRRSSFFSPSKYKTASNIMPHLWHSSTASWWPKFSQENLSKYLGPEKKGYYNGMSSDILPILFIRDTAISLNHF